MSSNDSIELDGKWLPSPAKLNLMLRIVGQRDDGYHLLQTVFQFLDYGDEMMFSVSTDGQIIIPELLPGVPLDQDLSYRAAQLLQETTKTSLGANIFNRKKLPMGGGLGGGSSNAATTLLALNELWKTGLSMGQLAQLGIRLGADVPVFVKGCAAWAEGIGDKLRCIELPEPWAVVIFPPVSVATKKIFSSPALTRDSASITIAAFLAGGMDTNDCLAVVSDLYPEVAEVIAWLGQHGSARLTGTGACVYALFPDQQTAMTVKQQVPDHWQVFVAKMTNRSALHRALFAGVSLPSNETVIT